MIKANLLMQTPPPTSEIVSDLEVSEAEKRELDSRWARFERDPSRAMTLEQFRELDIARRG
jgi:putative addiction module component (TIGR02574 family)